MIKKRSRLLILIGIMNAVGFYGCNQETYMQGKRLYTAHCADCHGDKGEGLERLVPPLANSDYLRDHQKELACIMTKGLNGSIVVNGVKYNQLMPGQKYTPVQISNIINYINHAWENNLPETSLPKVKEQLKNCD